MTTEGQSNNRRPNNKKRNRRPKNKNYKGSKPQVKNTRGKKPFLTGVEKAVNSYLNLLEKHLTARKKYFELYHRADPKQLAKLERIFHKSVDDLRAYEGNIKKEHLQDFKKHLNGLNLDTRYSSNHELDVEAPEVSHDTVFEDPHYLEIQKESNFSEDIEESQGSIEDYLKYKGLNE